MHDDRMLGRHLVEVARDELPFVLDLRVVEEISVHPHAGRRLLCLGAQLLDDAVDRDELHLERIPDEHFI